MIETYLLEVAFNLLCSAFTFFVFLLAGTIVFCLFCNYYPQHKYTHSLTHSTPRPAKTAIKFTQFSRISIAQSHGKTPEMFPRITIY
jgi:hypothetical protein